MRAVSGVHLAFQAGIGEFEPLRPLQDKPIGNWLPFIHSETAQFSTFCLSFWKINQQGAETAC